MTKVVGGLLFFALPCWTLHIDEQEKIPELKHRNVNAIMDLPVLRRGDPMTMAFKQFICQEFYTITHRASPYLFVFAVGGY
jgi:hypothetical protein